MAVKFKSIFCGKNTVFVGDRSYYADDCNLVMVFATTKQLVRESINHSNPNIDGWLFDYQTRFEDFTHVAGLNFIIVVEYDRLTRYAMPLLRVLRGLGALSIEVSSIESGKRSRALWSDSERIEVDQLNVFYGEEEGNVSVR